MHIYKEDEEGEQNRRMPVLLCEVNYIINYIINKNARVATAYRHVRANSPMAQCSSCNVRIEMKEY